jgi:hypothetical protein
VQFSFFNLSRVSASFSKRREEEKKMRSVVVKEEIKRSFPLLLLLLRAENTLCLSSANETTPTRQNLSVSGCFKARTTVRLSCVDRNFLISLTSFVGKEAGEIFIA